MNKKSRSEQKEPPPNALDAEGSPAAQLPTFPEMTSSEYRRLSGGNLQQKLVNDYINLAELVTLEQILEQQMRTLGNAGAKDCQQALTRAQEIHQETLWEARRELVVKMYRCTLESLAEHFGILPASEFVRDHPYAKDLENGLLLARMRQFLVCIKAQGAPRPVCGTAVDPKYRHDRSKLDDRVRLLALRGHFLKNELLGRFPGGEHGISIGHGQPGNQRECVGLIAFFP